MAGNTAGDEPQLTSGMNPPCRMPRSARAVRNEVRPDSLHWQTATIDHRVSCAGIQRSGPAHFETSWDGSSAAKKESEKTVAPRLKSATRRCPCQHASEGTSI